MAEKGIYCFMPKRSYNKLADTDKRGLLEPIGEVVDLMPRIQQFISDVPETYLKNQWPAF